MRVAILIAALSVGACKANVATQDAGSKCGPCVESFDCPGTLACVNGVCEADGGGVCEPIPGVPDGGPFVTGTPPGPITTSLTADGGGTESQLYFAIVGDTRPENEDDSPNYPTPLISKIYADIQALSPSPPIVIGTGDYQYADPRNTDQQTQLNDYNSGRILYSGLFWPAMGNHECTGYTADECGPGNTYGITLNFSVFQTMFLNPIGESNPYYVRTVSAPDGSWTAKFIVVALNYWTTDQQTWLQGQLASPGTYTFVIHHEDSGAGDPPPLATVESMEASAETLSIVGHSHTWRHYTGSKELIVGNGGAPMTSSVPFGYTLVARQPNGSLLVSGYDCSTNEIVNQFSVP